MKDPAQDSKTRESNPRSFFPGDSGGVGTSRHLPIPAARYPHSGVSRRRTKSILKVCQYLCLLLAVVCLGYVAFNYAGADMFQTYQSWRFDQIIGHQPASRMSSLMKWVDQRLSSFMKPPIAKVNPVKPSPAPESHAPVPAIEPLSTGSLIGRMEIPRIGVSVMVLEGDSKDILRNGAGHVPTTGFPGGPGNVVVAGHRDTFFRALRDIRKDDEITFTTTQGTFHYQVETTEKVGPEDIRVLEASDHPLLTLITCYPFNYIGPAPRRFVVQAGQIPTSPTREPEQTVASVPAQAVAGVPPVLYSPAKSRPKSPAPHKIVHRVATRSTAHSPRRRVTPPPAKTPVAEELKSASSETPIADPPPAALTTTQHEAAESGKPDSVSEKQTAVETRYQNDTVVEAPKTKQPVLGKVRAWLRSIPGHLHQN
jgi:sortase A